MELRAAGMALWLMALGLAGAAQAAEFACASGDVACLIEAIHAANANGEENTIALEPGTYTLTVGGHFEDGSNGLPSVTSPLTIRGEGVEGAVVERAPDAAQAFRLIHVGEGGILTLERLILRGGFSDIGGGVLNKGTLSLVNSTVADHAVFALGCGGGIWNSGTLTLLASTVADNTARAPRVVSGGGIFSSGALTLLNSTIAGNRAGLAGGGMAVSGTATLHNTIVAGNTVDRPPLPDAPLGPDCSSFGTPIISLGHNLLGDPTGCTIDLQPSDRTGDPALAAFADDGIPGHGHFPLLPTSPAIDAGDDAACPPTDQLGQPRVGPCDIGAVEFQAAAPLSCQGTGSFRLRGRVRGSDGRPGLAGATLTLEGPEGCRDVQLTDADGGYRFRRLASGTYIVRPSKPGCTFVPTERTVNIADANVRAGFRGRCP
jgi:hypothetical protein